MFNQIIRLALQFRLVIVGLALATLVIGSLVANSLPIDVLPNLTRPRVVVVTECHGMAPEEVEQRVTIPLETAINGATGVIAIRSSSDIGLSVINVEFDWNADVYTARQIVQERMAHVQDRLPPEVVPQMGPISSLLGQIVLVGMWSKDGTTDPLELRTQADWVVRQRLLTISGVSQVIVMGGGRKQYQVLVDQHKLHQYEVSLPEVEAALSNSNLNVTGGYLDRQSEELLIRGLGRLQGLEDIRQVPIKMHRGRAVLVGNVAQVVEAAQLKRGDSSVNGQDAVVLTIQKQPNADTRRLTEEIRSALDELRAALPPDVVIEPTYEQREFIDHGVANVVEALRDGAILVVIVLFVFLLNFRTTFITLTAIPLSILVTALVFRWFGLSINVMTLGGIAVAMGELVDDAIVDVENIFRRLRENRRAENPSSIVKVIFEASVEVRNAIIVSTILVIVVFAPLFALSGIEGRLFTPLGVAYIVSILASTLVSLTVTPALSYYLLPYAKVTSQEDGPFLRGLKWLAAPVVRFSMTSNGLATSLAALAILTILGMLVTWSMGKNFLPPFDEGAAQVNLFAAPGTSLSTSREISRIADREFKRLVKTPDAPEAPLLWFTCRTGRAEQDEHVMGVNVSEYVMSINPDCPLGREEVIEQLHHAVEDMPFVETEVEQPIAHLISHMLSGVTAQIAIKLFGDDLDVLRAKAQEIKEVVERIEGIAPPVVEQQQITPQFRIELKRQQLAYYGLAATDVHHFIETAMNGSVVTQLIEGQRSFDLLVRLAAPYRNDLRNFHRMPFELPDGRRITLGDVARVYEGGGPNTISRDEGRRRIVVRVNTMGKDLSLAVSEIQQAIADQVELPEGYFVTYGGQFEAQQTASRRILGLSVVAFVVVFMVLYSTYPSTSIVVQILFALPAAFVGGVLALMITGQAMSVAAMVGFISLGGIAARNGLLLISTYLERIPEQGFTQEMILGGSLDRLAPVLMTALTTGIGLVPLVIGGALPGKEILYPVATVILGGLVTSTLCEFLLRPGMFWFFADSFAKKMAATPLTNPSPGSTKPAEEDPHGC